MDVPPVEVLTGAITRVGHRDIDSWKGFREIHADSKMYMIIFLKSSNHPTLM